VRRQESWDWATEQTYTPRGARRPVALADHEHTCPDGTRVVVTAQYIEITDVTLYRWVIGGVRSQPTSVRGDRRGTAPDWTAVDADHRAVA
jgi:hypothetical protein